MIHTKLDKQNIKKVLLDLLIQELSGLRGYPIKSSFFDHDNKWELDSLEIIPLAGRVNQFFHLYETGLEDNLLRKQTLSNWIEIVYQSWQINSSNVTFQTSGSTGKPKKCTHNTERLYQEIVELSKLVQDQKRILSFVPSHHIYGFLFTILLPTYLNIPLIDLSQHSIGKINQELKEYDLIIGIPVWWDYLSKSLNHFPDHITGINSTAPMDEDLIFTLKDQGISKFYEIYGSTETGGIGYRSSPNQPYELFSYWSFENTEKNQAQDLALIQAQSDRINNKTFYLMDNIELIDSRHFYPVGRKDGGVQVGGKTVYPKKVAEKIRTHSKVKDCVVRLCNNTNRFKAFIIPSENELSEMDLRDELEKWILNQFKTEERVIHLTFGKQIPRSSMGKVTDW